MGKLKQYFKVLKKVITEPKSLNKVLLPDLEDYRFSKGYVQSKYNIEQLPSVWIDDLIRGFNVQITNYSYLNGTSLIIDIALLKSLASQFEKCQYLEIGSWRGESISNVAKVADHCYSVTLSASDMKSRGFDQKIIDLHGFYSKGLKNITEILTDSTKYDFSKLNKSFDLIFIDGDHSKNAVEIDTKNAFELLKNDDSIIVWHDYGWDTEKVRYNTLAGILDGAPDHKRDQIYHVANTKCAIYTNRKLPTFKWQVYNQPKINFNIEISANRKY